MFLVLVTISLILLYLGRRLWKTGLLYLDPVYIAIRNNGNPDIGPISKGVLRQLVRPWRRGVGVEFKKGKYVLHIGLCWRQRNLNGNDGTLSNLDGRWLPDTPLAIKDWPT